MGGDLAAANPNETVNRPTQGSIHLDAIRGAAALMVFANHTRALYFPSALRSVPQLQQSATQTATHQRAAPSEIVGEIKFASEAVIIFFVLSGYLVGGSVLRLIRNNRWSWSVYLTKRVVRLYVVLIPAILFGVTLDYLGYHYLGTASAYYQPPGMELGTSFHLADRFHAYVLIGNALFLESILVPFPGTNVSIWSLINEFWYYLAFPLIVLALTAKQSPFKRFAYAIGACAVIVFVGKHIAILFPIWILGALANILPRRLAAKQAKLVSAFLTALLLAGMVGVRFFHLQMVQAGYLLGILVSLLIWAIVQQTEPSKDGLYKSVAGFFSRISYTLYLFHIPLAMFASGLINSPWKPWTYTVKNISMFVMVDAIVVLIVYGFWSLFEKNTDKIRSWVFEREHASPKTSAL